jgi:signal transduction histidine kinase
MSDFRQSRPTIALVTLAIAAIGTVHAWIPATSYWHSAVQHLIYIPIVYAGLRFGCRAGIAAGGVAGICNLPYCISAWNTSKRDVLDQAIEIFVASAAAGLAGLLSERQQRERATLQETTRRLADVYRELQENFEHMKRAERLSALGQLSAGLAHEIRNPLAAIAGAAGILNRSSQVQPKHLECLQIIDRECQRLNRLLSNFLDFARPRPPRFELTPVGPVIDSVVDLAGHAVGRTPIMLRKEIEPLLPPVECDPELLKQVLLNLIINAIQAMPRGGEVVTSAVRRNGRVLIQVCDHGCGIGHEDRDRIFDPFFTTKPTGTGLGLSVAHQIVEQHGGLLTSEPNSDAGMTFSVLLPLRREGHHETTAHSGHR